MARGAGKLRQDIYVTKLTETRSGIDRVRVYSKPVKYRLSVSATAGTPGIFNAGIVPDYDREITVFKGQFTGFNADEGSLLYVDVAPELDENGDLVLNAEGEPTVHPDYVLVRKLAMTHGQVARYGIKKVDYGKDT